ncbi:MAG TPA: hypothetical protein VN698_04330 [Bacteroidia bacterium]|nr:hypothetical protein [Bacteroidia bacterium]
MNKLIKISLLFFTLTISQLTNAQNVSVNGTTIGGTPSNEILKPCAIIISPTKKEVKQLTKTEGGDSMQTNNDNANLFIEIIKKYLASTDTPVIEREAKGELKFKLIDDTIYILPIDKLYWDVFLFNGESVPIKVTAADFEKQYIKYMKIEK